MTGDAALVDSTLRLFDAAGGFLASATGYGQNAAEIVFTATAAGPTTWMPQAPTAPGAAAIR